MSSTNSKSFTLLRKVSKSFTIFISGFSVSDTFIFLCKIPVFKMVANAKIAQKLTAIISFGKNRITISKFAMSQKESVSITIKPMIMSFITKLSEKWLSSNLGSNGYIQIPLYITALTKATERWLNNTVSLDQIKLGKNTIVFSPTLASFLQLSVLDSQTLEVLDIQTLEDLDYIVT